MEISHPRSFGLLRIAFGGVWAIDSFFKWQPAFQNNFVGYLTDAMPGQPALVASWIQLWINIVSVQPHLFAIAVALTETAIALSLLTGLFARPMIVIGALFSLVIWAVPEGFGGPYTAGATDVGTALIYMLVFLALWLGRSWEFYSVRKG